MHEFRIPICIDCGNGLSVVVNEAKFEVALRDRRDLLTNPLRPRERLFSLVRRLRSLKGIGFGIYNSALGVWFGGPSWMAAVLKAEP